MGKIGNSDRVAEISDAKDLLNVENYYKAAAHFLTKCEMPMTMSIQGDWGTGKTTAIKLIIREIDEINAKEKNNSGVDKYIPIEFNTWQYSQYGSEGKLIEGLLTELGKKLGQKDKSGNIGNHFNVMKCGIMAKDLITKVAGTSLGVFTEVFTANGEAGSAVNNLTAYIANKFGVDGFDLEKNKAELEKEIAGLFSKAGYAEDEGRFIVFVDDLDRLKPEVAVELLEAIKIFLDLKSCVFVLAMDEAIVTQGIRNKYQDSFSGIGEEELKNLLSDKGRKFFDKIIQVPFDLPVNNYDIENYVTQLFFKGINEAKVTAYLPKYMKALNVYGVTNPRTIKRLYNQLELYKRILNVERSAEKDEYEKIFNIFVYILANENDADRDAIRFNVEYLSLKVINKEQAAEETSLSEGAENVLKALGISESLDDKDKEKIIRRYLNVIASLGKKTLNYGMLTEELAKRGINATIEDSKVKEKELKIGDRKIAKITSHFSESQYNITVYPQSDDDAVKKQIDGVDVIEQRYMRDYIITNRNNGFVVLVEPSEKIAKEWLLPWIDQCLGESGVTENNEEE